MCDCVLELGMWSRNNIRRKVFTLLPVVVLLFRSLGSEMRPIIKHRSVGDEGIRTCVKTFQISQRVISGRCVSCTIESS